MKDIQLPKLDPWIVEKFGNRVAEISSESVISLTQGRKERYEDSGFKAVLEMEFNDRCKNGHNTFSMTWSTFENVCGRWEEAGGGRCDYDEVKKYFPKFAKYHRWHLCSTDSPLHYLENTAYWVRANNLPVARATAVWPNATLEELSSPAQLKARLPKLLELFRADMNDLGFTW